MLESRPETTFQFVQSHKPALEYLVSCPGGSPPPSPTRQRYLVFYFGTGAAAATPQKEQETTRLYFGRISHQTSAIPPAKHKPQRPTPNLASGFLGKPGKRERSQSRREGKESRQARAKGAKPPSPLPHFLSPFSLCLLLIHTLPDPRLLSFAAQFSRITLVSTQPVSLCASVSGCCVSVFFFYYCTVTAHTNLICHVALLNPYY